MKQPLYKKLAGLITAINNCKASNNTEWQENHTATLRQLCDEYLPNGSGIDSGSRMELSASTPNKLVFCFDYHHMRDGYYTHWTSHIVTVTPSLFNDIDIKITKDGIRDYSLMDYLYEVWNYALTCEVE